MKLNEKNNVYVGAAYYPEVWDLGNVDHDIEQMREAGCNIMRIGEFAWGAMEPSEGIFTFDWLHEVVDKLHAAGIKVIMCTPSATPPQWLVNKYEEVLAMNDMGVRSQHGARRHTCPNSPTGREYNRRINVAMAKEFGNDPAIIGWQIDNELHFFEGKGCSCPICKSRFKDYLRSKYSSIGELNEKWGMSRWSLTYDSFDTIIPPRKDTWNHPSLVMYWDYFMSDSYVAFSDEQADILHEYTSAPVGTDMMPFMDVSYVDVHKKLDMVQFNHYDDQHNVHRITFWLDYIRGILDVPYWVTETQTGWNGSVAASASRPDGYTYMNSWLSLALGGKMNMYWLWKAHPHGHELMHGAVVSSSGRLNHPTREIVQLSEELATCDDFLTNTKVASKAAIHFTHPAYVTFKAVPRMWGFNYCERLKDEFYLPIAQGNHVGLDVIEYNKSLDNYKVLFSPYLCVMDDDLRARIIEWVRASGTWIVGPHSDVLDTHGKHFTDSPFGMLEELTGVYCKYQIPSDNREFEITWNDGQKTKGKSSYDGFEAAADKVLASYTDGSLKGLAAHISANVGKGKVIILGTAPDASTIKKILELAELRGYDASENVYVVERSGDNQSGIILLELRGSSEGYAVVDGDYIDIVSNTKYTRSTRIAMSAYEVRVLKKI